MCARATGTFSQLAEMETQLLSGLRVAIVSQTEIQTSGVAAASIREFMKQYKRGLGVRFSQFNYFEFCNICTIVARTVILIFFEG